jgi:hypothetical protein
MAPESGSPAAGEVQKQAGLSQEIQALAENFQSSTPVPVQATASQPESVSSVNGHSSQTLTAATIAPDEIDSLVRPLVESAELPPQPAPPVAPAAPWVLPADVDLEPAHPAVSETLQPRSEAKPVSAAPAVPSSSGPRIEVVAVAPMATGMAPLAGPRPQTAPAVEPEKPQPSSQAAPSHSSLPAVVAAPAKHPELALPAADLVVLNEALLKPAHAEQPELPGWTDQPAPVSSETRILDPVFDSVRVALPSEPLAEPAHDTEVLEEAYAHQAKAMLEVIAAQHAAEQAQTAKAADALSRAQELQAEEVVDEIKQQLDAEDAAIRALAATFQDQTKTRLLTAPSEIVAAPAPAAVQWIRTPRPVLTPSAPQNTSDNLFSGGPHAPTLPGPCLPPQLRNYIETPSSSGLPDRKPISFPSWLVSVVVATFLFLCAGSLMQYVTANRDAKAASAAPITQPVPVTPAPAPAPAPALPIVHEHPSARFVEVAGVRVVTGPNKKPQLQYIVINHSSSQLTGLDVRIAGRSVDTPTGASPLFSVSEVVAALGPYQSKELRTDLGADLRSAVPDWQSLRTEVLIARH